jgi:hypothetical protein
VSSRIVENHPLLIGFDPDSSSSSTNGFAAPYLAESGLHGLQPVYEEQRSSGSGSGHSSDYKSSSEQTTATPAQPVQHDPDITYGGLMTPNTQTILQQFFSLSPTGEQTIDFPLQTVEPSTQLSLYTREQPAMQSWDPTNPLAPMPMYEAPFLLPTGLNLLRPPVQSYGTDPADIQRFLSGMDEQSVAYHLGLPLNLSKQELQISGPAAEEPAQVPPIEADLSIPPFDSNWFSDTEPARKPKDPIDVPPFLRDKLLHSYFHNLQRCPSYYVDRDQLYRRMEGSGDRPHTSWLFSMVSRSVMALTRYSFLNAVPSRIDLAARPVAKAHGRPLLQSRKGELGCRLDADGTLL